MKKFIFLLVAFALSLVTTIANDVGKAPTSSYVIEQQMQQPAIIAHFDLKVDPVIKTETIMYKSMLINCNSDKQSYCDPDYGRYRFSGVEVNYKSLKYESHNQLSRGHCTVRHV